ncbi:unnamed protein product [Arabis nemorensis]|uniref:Uncharacterized protein n=1 Tax=Arabis nemorensis TaxID=586526 RepID=A0A565B9R9_9BRAS|nr:unnamed protein product [Arabis nemorensis]
MNTEGLTETKAEHADQQATNTTEAGEPQEHVEPAEQSPQPLSRRVTRSQAASLSF